MPRHVTRRQMLRNTALAGVGVWIAGRRGSAIAQSPNERLSVACIGVGGRGRANVRAVASAGAKVVALCDVDDKRAGDAFENFPRAKKYYDFRRMLDAMERQIDAVVVSTPDHTHAPPSVMAMRMGKHVYCEKPLAHNVYECRLMAELAAETKLATQLGTQYHNHHRQVVELIRSGAIGPVREAHAMIGGSRGGGERPTETPPVPPHLKWDLWLGPRPWRPYHPDYVPYRWRFWWDFGTGETGNNGVHILDIPFWALDLRHPATIEAEGPPVHEETSPTWMRMRFEFPARGDMPPVKLHFYHSAETPPAMAAESLPEWRPNLLGDWKPRVVFRGDEGVLVADLRRWKLLPESKFADFQPPKPTVPKSIGHHREWVAASKTGEATGCGFPYGGALTEMILLGNVAYRLGEKLDWDPKNMRAPNCPEADKYIKEQYREGWRL